MTSKQIFQVLSTFSSYVWFLSVLSFSLTVAYTTQFFTYDPNYSPGGNEEAWLIPMLGSVLIGFLAFVLTVGFGIFGRFTRGKEKYNAPLGVNAWLSTIGVVIILGAWLVFLFGQRQANLGYKSRAVSYTGQELFDAINDYRETQGINRLVLNEKVCDNLVERHRVIASGDVGHEGFNEWVKEEGLEEEGWTVGELYVKYVSTTKDAVDYWVGSPGHRLTLLNKSMTDGCAYAQGDTTVLIMATKNFVPTKE